MSAIMDNPSPLSNIRVLDLSRVVAGPFAGRMMRDLGADVVKIEPPEGDTTRLWGKRVGRLPGYYFQQNAGKRNICLDLRIGEAVEAVRRLITHCDVLIENYRPGVMDRLGLSYASLKAINPRLVMLSISGFGQAGPEALRPAYAPVVHAEVGFTDRNRRRAGSNADIPLPIADTNASLHGLVAVLAALLLRERTGEGQHIDMAMIEASLVTNDAFNIEVEEAEATMPENSVVWDTGAGPAIIAADNRYLWKTLSPLYRLQEPADAMSLEAKIKGRARAMGDFLMSLNSWEAVDAAMARGNIAWGQVRSGSTVEEQPTLRHRGSVVQIDDRAGGTRPVPQSPYRFSAASSFVRGPAPHRGEHNEEVLATWGEATRDEIDALYAAGALIRPTDRAAS
jgi:CoA:oxalate CoA-transferase